MAGLGVMIGKYTLDSQHGDQLASCQCWLFFFRYTNNSSFRYTHDEQFDHSHHRPLRRKWTRKDNKLALYCYFRSNLAKRGYRRRMIEIWTEFDRFKATNQRLADQIRTITKSHWFSDLEILEIYQQIYRQTRQQTPTTIIETMNTEGQRLLTKHYMTMNHAPRTHKRKH